MGLAHASVVSELMKVSTEVTEVKPPKHTAELDASRVDTVGTRRHGTEPDMSLHSVSIEPQHENGENLQDVVRDLMVTILEIFPETLDEETIRHLEVAKNPFGLNISGHTLLRRVSEGRSIGQHNRYWKRVYGGRWYVCSQWWAQAHRHNAQMLVNWIDQLRANADQNEISRSLSDIRKRLDAFRDMF